LMLHVRVDDELKAQATQTLEAMGLSVSDAARILLKRVVDDQAFPLELKVPNAQTRKAMEEARAMARPLGRATTRKPSSRTGSGCRAPAGTTSSGSRR
jgi:DNA-damage-inducible protein J